jgi:hypothetical protein
VIEALVSNPAAPAGLLLTVLAKDPEAVARGLGDRTAHDRGPHGLGHDLPEAFRAALTTHPSWRVRAAVSAFGPPLLDDPDWRVRVRGFRTFGVHPPDDERLTQILGDLAHPPDDQPFYPHELLEELFAEMRHAPRLYAIAAGHADADVRRFVATSVGRREELRFLRADRAPEVRAVAEKAIAEHYRLMRPADLPDHHTHGFWWVLNRPLSRELIDQVLASGDLLAIAHVATNTSVPPDVIAELAGHPDPRIRAAAAARTGPPTEPPSRPATDPVDADPVDADPAAADPEAADPEAADPEAADPEAADPEARRLVAFDPGADPEVVHRLCADPDPRVRRAMAGSPRLAADRVAALLDDSELARYAAANPNLPVELMWALIA